MCICADLEINKGGLEKENKRCSCRLSRRCWEVTVPLWSGVCSVDPVLPLPQMQQEGGQLLRSAAELDRPVMVSGIQTMWFHMICETDQTRSLLFCVVLFEELWCS